MPYANRHGSSSSRTNCSFPGSNIRGIAVAFVARASVVIQARAVAVAAVVVIKVVLE